MPQSPPQSNTQPIQDRPLVTLTDRAIAKVESALAGGTSIGVRLKVRREKGSFAYTFDYVAANGVDPRDPVFLCGQWRFYVDHDSVDLIRDAEIDYLSSGFTQGWVIDNPNPAWDSELARRIAAVLNETINPGLAQHGGHITLVDLKDNIAYVEMSGGCQGCSMATKTLRHGVMRVLADQFPEITDLVDTTDHTNGSRPFFKSGEQGQSPTF